MQRRRVLAAATGAVSAAGAGCLSSLELGSDCPEPSEGSEMASDYRSRFSSWSDADFADDPRRPHAILLTEADSLDDAVLDLLHDDEEAFVRETDFENECLVILQLRVRGAHRFEFTGAERVTDETVRVYACLTSRDGDQPAYDDVHTSFIRLARGGDVPEEIDAEYRDLAGGG